MQTSIRLRWRGRLARGGAACVLAAILVACGGGGGGGDGGGAAGDSGAAGAQGGGQAGGVGGVDGAGGTGGTGGAGGATGGSGTAGGGSGAGGGTGGTGGTDPAGGMVTLRGIVIDGTLQGATVCLDVDGDLDCGGDEPRSAPTDALGRWTLAVPAAAAGRHGVVATVPVGALDADSGLVFQAYTLSAPAGRHEVISPIAGLVHEMAVHGTPLDEAVAAVGRMLALRASPLADHVAARASTDPALRADAARTSTIARLLVRFRQETRARIPPSAALPATETATMSLLLGRIDALRPELDALHAAQRIDTLTIEGFIQRNMPTVPQIEAEAGRLRAIAAR